MRGAHTLLIGIVVIILLAHFASSVTEISVEETDLVSLQLQTYDDDGDPLIYSFSPPLDDAGRWQTDYGDVGEYIVDVTVSDGTTSTTQQIKLIILAKNRPPKIENIKDLIVKEGDVITINPKATDYEGDDVTIKISPPIGNDGEWQTDYTSAGVYNITVIADDGSNQAVDHFTLTILNQNRAPQIKSYQPLSDTEIAETDKLTFQIVANDVDYENITYEWYVDGVQVSDQSRYIYQPNYDSAGPHQIKGSVSDGEKVSAIYWNVIVNNLNREPVLKEMPPVTVNEGDLVKIEPEGSDPDKDVLSYTFSAPFNEEGEWQTTNDDSGVHDVIVTVSDGELNASQTVKITVKNVDRPPVFTGEIEKVEVNEGDELDLILGIDDPDGDVIALTAEGLPKGATLTGNRLIYKPDYAVIRKSDSWFTHLIQKIHMGWIFSDKESFKVSLTATSKELSAKKNIKITILDSNRAPVLQEIGDVTIKENDLLVLKPKATDYDFDKLNYKISLPLGNDGRWQTDFEDNGIYNITVTASDGELQDTQTVKVIVENFNRKPVFEKLPVITINENEQASLSLKNKVSDGDGDPITLTVENLPQGAVFEDEVITWKPDYEIIQEKTDSITNKLWSKMPFLNRAYSPDKKEFTVKVIAADRESAVEKEVTIIVKNVNRIPKINDTYPIYTSIRAYKNQPILFGAIASDPDNDTLSYTWKLGAFKTIKGSPVISRVFTESGEKEIKLEISDGLNTKTKTWTVKV
ncbi:hypothetical protein KY331_01220 [Candidatus Woesearchaeota archaeon]|nr:hypothetical protein [Candidatus Woesearchaeota archaeon]